MLTTRGPLGVAEKGGTRGREHELVGALLFDPPDARYGFDADREDGVGAERSLPQLGIGRGVPTIGVEAEKLGGEAVVENHRVLGLILRGDDDLLLPAACAADERAAEEHCDPAREPNFHTAAEPPSTAPGIPVEHPRESARRTSDRLSGQWPDVGFTRS